MFVCVSLYACTVCCVCADSLYSEGLDLDFHDLGSVITSLGVLSSNLNTTVLSLTCLGCFGLSTATRSMFVTFLTSVCMSCLCFFALDRLRSICVTVSPHTWGLFALCVCVSKLPHTLNYLGNGVWGLGFGVWGLGFG